jgi:hypothetical protein
MLAYEFSVTDRVAGLHAGIAMDETQLAILQVE